MEAFLSVAFAAQVVGITVPYLLAALGSVLSERSGVVNIALEGTMLAGALAAVGAWWAIGGALAGVIGGVLAGMLVSAILAVAVLRFRADAVVSGVALNLLCLGATRFILKLAFDSSSNSPRVETITPLVEADGTAGPLLALVTDPLLLLALALVAGTHILLYRTAWGLRLRACGEHGEAAASVGIRVDRVRWAAVLASGALAGLGGVWLAARAHQFTDNMTAGRGYIALAAMILGRRDPLRAAAACLVFGAAEAIQFVLQGRGLGVPTQLLQMLPYVLTIVALVVFRKRARG